MAVRLYFIGIQLPLCCHLQHVATTAARDRFPAVATPCQRASIIKVPFYGTLRQLASILATPKKKKKYIEKI